MAVDVEGETGLISDLDREMKVEKQDGNDNKCEYCGKVLTRKRAMRLHVKRVHLKIKDEMKVEKQSNENDIKCNRCDKVLNRNCDLKLHIKRVHLKIKDHVCGDCTKLFTTINELNTHRIVHEERKFPCSICGLKIRSKVSLVNHMEGRHMGISKKPYFCQDCGIHHSNTAHKLIHMDRSMLEKFPCDDCGKQFGLKKNLKKHEMTHTAKSERSEVIYSNNFKMDVLKKSEEIGIAQIAKLVGIKDSTIKGWGHDDEGRLVVHHNLQMKKEVVAYALDNSVSEAEKKYKIDESTIRWWIKRLKKCDAMEDIGFAMRKDYVQRKYSAQVLNSKFLCILQF